MAKQPPSQFRLSDWTLGCLDALAASAGTRSAALRECVHHWHAEVGAAARLNADGFAPADWRRLGEAGDPADNAPPGEEWYPHWPTLLARGVVDVYEGRPVTLPLHREGRAAAAELAGRVAGLSAARGYAMMAALRYLWSHPDTAEAWYEPEVFLVAETRAEAEPAAE